MNSFDLLRLLSAVAVILHHTGPLQGLPAPQVFATDFGALGVGVFFVISGYLVTPSLQRSATIGDYLKKRLLRIEPALVVSLALTAFALGAAVTTLPLAEYLRDPRVYLYVARNALLYPVTYDLPGVFKHNPITAVNPSLWTLRLEFTCYLGLVALRLLKLLRLRVLAALLALAAATTLTLGVIWPQAGESGVLRLVLIAVQFGFLFLAGSALSLAGGRPPLWSLASLVFVATPMWILALPAAVVRVGELRSPRLPGDFSYGLYIYACPVQQALAMAGGLSFWAALALTTPLAVASWFLVERPALKFKPAPRPVVAGHGPPQPALQAPATTPARPQS
jgi:peptidoglycan/LPS O-acetylase OafA/YrhL